MLRSVILPPGRCGAIKADILILSPLAASYAPWCYGLAEDGTEEDQMRRHDFLVIAAEVIE
jgi:hypothetical protein